VLVGDADAIYVRTTAASTAKAVSGVEKGDHPIKAWMPIPRTTPATIAELMADLKLRRVVA
jgi:hypothetical protein